MQTLLADYHRSIGQVFAWLKLKALVVMEGPAGQFVPYRVRFDLWVLRRLERWSRTDPDPCGPIKSANPYSLVEFLIADCIGSRVCSFLGWAPPCLLTCNVNCREVAMWYCNLPHEYLEGCSHTSSESMSVGPESPSICDFSSRSSDYSMDSQGPGVSMDGVAIEVPKNMCVYVLYTSPQNRKTCLLLCLQYV